VSGFVGSRGALWGFVGRRGAIGGKRRECRAVSGNAGQCEANALMFNDSRKVQITVATYRWGCGQRYTIGQAEIIANGAMPSLWTGGEVGRLAGQEAIGAATRAAGRQEAVGAATGRLAGTKR
jgi:hypothetical protein